MNTPLDSLTEIHRAGAHKMLAEAIEEDVASYVAQRSDLSMKADIDSIWQTTS